jgi:alanyl-tRNA synthetase
MTPLPPYWIDPLKDQFLVTIADSKPTEEHFETTIEEDVVKAAGGGQAGDRGILRINQEEIVVRDTMQRDGVVMMLTEKGLTRGVKATLIIDMNWRRSIMRNHTAEHLFAAALKERYPSLKPGAMWIDGNHGTVEMVGAKVDLQELFSAEKSVQNTILRDIPVSTEIVKASELDKSIRARESVEAKHEMVRVVRIGDSDAAACSGTHVLRTGDLGIFKLVDYKMEEESVHVEFLTGNRAVTILYDLFNAALERRRSHPFELEQLGAVLDRGKRVTSELAKVLEKMEHLLNRGPTVEDIGGTSFRHEFLPGFEVNSLKRVLKNIKLDGPSAILYFAPGEKCNLVFWTNDLPREAAIYINDAVTKLGGRGGGSEQVYTGGFSNVDNPEKIYDDLVEQVRAQLLLR